MQARALPCPEWFDDGARLEWRRLANDGVVDRGDPATVAAYCYTASLWAAVRRVVDRLDAEGATGWFDHEGQERPHPAIAVEARLASDLLALSEALGLEPRGRESARPTRVLFLDEGD
jgi:P27 family predicted phage terminase small subunit